MIERCKCKWCKKRKHSSDFGRGIGNICKNCIEDYELSIGLKPATNDSKV